MHKTLLLLLLSTLTSCLNTDELNLNKYEYFILEPEVLLPFVQIDLSDKFYDEINADISITEKVIDMDIDTFEDLKLSDNVKRIDFNFNAINGYPIRFDNISVIFMDKNDAFLEQIILNDIGAAKLKSDGSLESPTIKKFQYIFYSSSIANIEKTRRVRVIISWKGNTIPYPLHHDSFYFNLNSDLVLKTSIDVGK